MQVSKVLLLSAVVVIVLSFDRAPAQDAGSEDIEAARLKMLKRWGGGGLIKPGVVDAEAKKLLALPLADQSDEDLMALAKRANTAANLVGLILEEYADYHRENYRFKFVQEKIVPFHDAYVELTNRLKHYRNQAYLHLGKKAVARGDKMTAFFMFRDAFRLSNFTVDKGDHKGVRYQAEIEMKKLLGIEKMGTFIYWK